MNARFSFSIGRLIAGAATLVAVFVLSFVVFAAPAEAGGTPACSTLIVGTRFTLPAMTVGQEAKVPEVSGATSLCVEAIEGPEELALKLSADFPFTANGNDTPLTVSSAFTTTMALPGGSFNGSLLKAAPVLPVVKIVALTDLSDGVTVWVGSPRASVVAPVLVDQWQEVKIPGNIAELAAGTTKWAGNGVTVKVTSGAAFEANGLPILPKTGEMASYGIIIDNAVELKLVGTVLGQRFYLSVDSAGLDPSAWLQRRVDPTPAAGKIQYKNSKGKYFATADCTGAPVPQDPAAETRTCGGAPGTIWSPPAPIGPTLPRGWGLN